MATAAVIDFGSFSSPSGAERVQSRLGSRIERGEFVDSGSTGARRNLTGSWGQARRCAPSWIKFGLWRPPAPPY